MKKRNNAGQTIIEIIIATAVVAIVMTALMMGLTYSIKNSSQARYKSLANQLAEEGMEFFRQQRALIGWEEFNATLAANDYCVEEDVPETLSGLSTASECEGITSVGTSFERRALVTKPGDKVRVELTVSWVDGVDTRQVELTQEFGDWN